MQSEHIADGQSRALTPQTRIKSDQKRILKGGNIEHPQLYPQPTANKLTTNHRRTHTTYDRGIHFVNNNKCDIHTIG
jgi:hypothetical protein